MASIFCKHSERICEDEAVSGLHGACWVCQGRQSPQTWLVFCSKSGRLALEGLCAESTRPVRRRYDWQKVLVGGSTSFVFQLSISEEVARSML